MGTSSLLRAVGLVGFQLAAFLVGWSVLVYPEVARYAFGFGDRRTVLLGVACCTVVVAVALYVLLNPTREESRYNAHREDSRDAG